MTGSPSQKSPDQRMFSSSPKLIAAFHVFHLHLTPRHPPFALSSLATIPQISLNTLMRTYLIWVNKSTFIKWSSFQSGSTTKPQALYFNQLLMIMLTTAQLIFTTTNCQRTIERSRLLKFARFDPSKLVSEIKSKAFILLFFPLKGGDPAADSSTATLLRLHPSYQPYLRRLLPRRVSPATSGIINSHGVTGGVYKAREHIHRGMLIRDY